MEELLLVMKKMTPLARLKFVLIALVLATALGTATVIMAQTDPSYGLNTTVNTIGITPINNVDTQLNNVIANIIKVILGITGVVFMGLIIYAGNLWMTAGGNEEQVRKARGMMTNAVVGILAVFAAYVITNFIVDQVVGFVTSAP